MGLRIGLCLRVYTLCVCSLYECVPSVCIYTVYILYIHKKRESERERECQRESVRERERESDSESEGDAHVRIPASVNSCWPGC